MKLGSWIHDQGAISNTVRAAGEAFGLTSVETQTSLHNQLKSLAAGVVELAPQMRADGAGHDRRDTAFVDIHGPAEALTPAARVFLTQLDQDKLINVEVMVDGAEVVRGN